GARDSQTAGRSGADRRRPPHYHAVLLRCRAGAFEESAAVVRLGERGRELDAFPPNGSRVAGHPHEELRRGQGQGLGDGAEEGASGEEHPYAVLYVRRQRIERPQHAQQRHPHGHHEVQPEGRARLHVVTSPGSRRCWKMQALGTRRSWLFASTIPSARSRGPATSPKLRHWRRRWQRPGPTSPGQAIQASPACGGSRSSRRGARRWYSITTAGLPMIRKVKCASYCWPDTLSTLGVERCGAILMPLLYKAIAQRWRARDVGRDRVQAFKIVGREMHSHQESAAPGRSRATRTLGD